jgi:hypothetical protein
MSRADKVEPKVVMTAGQRAPWMIIGGSMDRILEIQFAPNEQMMVRESERKRRELKSRSLKMEG